MLPYMCTCVCVCMSMMLTCVAMHVGRGLWTTPKASRAGACSMRASRTISVGTSHSTQKSPKFTSDPSASAGGVSRARGFVPRRVAARDCRTVGSPAVHVGFLDKGEPARNGCMAKLADRRLAAHRSAPGVAPPQPGVRVGTASSSQPAYMSDLIPTVRCL